MKRLLTTQHIQMKKIHFTFALLFVSIIGAQAQDAATETQDIAVKITANAIVDVVDDALTFDFTGNVATEAGEAFTLTGQNTQSTYLQYTLMQSNAGADDGTISVKISGLQPGLTLKMGLTAPTGLTAATNGILGSVNALFADLANPVALTGSDAAIITGIGSCFTGEGATEGVQIDYTMEISDYSLLDADDGSQDNGTVTFTIAE